MANKNSYKYNEKTEEKKRSLQNYKKVREKSNKKGSVMTTSGVCLFSHVHGRSLLVGGGSALGKLARHSKTLRYD